MTSRVALAAFLILPAVLPAQQSLAGQWISLRTPHFELFTDASERDGRGLLRHLEQLRSLAAASQPSPGFLPLPPGEPAPAETSRALPVRIIAFSSVSEYAEYRLHDTADAYYAGAPNRDYIVMPLRDPDDFGTAAHEYAHALAHRWNLRAPPWLSEGMAEVFARVRFLSGQSAGQAILIAPDASRIQLLRRQPWIPLAQITSLEDVQAYSRDQGSMFYAESWALTHMLLFSPAYRARFGALLSASANRFAGPAVLGEIYKTPIDSLERDLRAWTAGPGRQRTLISATAANAGPVAVMQPLAQSEFQLALASLQLDTGNLERARAVYVQLETAFPANPEIQAGLARIALSRADLPEARTRFRRALALGARDANFYYEYATSGEDLGLQPEERIEAFQRALALDPELDKARYWLALAHRDAGQFAAAVEQFLQVKSVPPNRAFGYYTALADSQLKLNRDADAAQSAAEAAKYAHTPDEVKEAGQLAWMARSDLVVQLASDGSARLTRVARGSAGVPAEWNPFIEAGDRIERKQGLLRDVDCSTQITRLVIAAGADSLVLTVPSPNRVQVRGSGTAQLTCGKQETSVAVEYAVAPDGGARIAGILRGIEFLR